ncbi:putative membrane protein [Janthinobacterium agaricidamnosum NBRC 102515 = DSM 9628]|uniref:Putative membrane protein n=1 Tax=Janthinobacterium agaricidamnosum NBRC 102515 = DSM 9628 TaxID=1349767 RepID=W0V7Q4_9BURK|nr:putative membrane protein [Janthinobacterium agaricidamnosum NBRC 102515 = DSM 9628]
MIWLKVAVVYLIIGIAIGIGMGASENLTLQPVHAHVNLLGWASMALAGLIYSVFPKAGQSRLAKFHFWTMNLALPVMMVTLGFLLFGHLEVLPVLVVSQIVAAVSVLAFAANIFKNLKP